jgi:hypothetical protein
MTEVTTHDARVLREGTRAMWPGNRYTGPPVLVARWGLVVVATVVWIAVVPLVSVAGELRRALKS